MAQTPEGKVKSWLYGTKDKPGPLYKYFPDAYVYKPPGGMFGQGGAPDCTLLWRGVFIAIEIKSDVGEATPLQLKRLKHIIRQGGVGAVLKGRDEVRLQAIYKAVMAKVEKYDAPGPIR